MDKILIAFGFVVVIALFHWLFASALENNCPKCGEKLEEWSNDPRKDYCKNGCKI